MWHKRHKFNAKKTEYNNRTYHSKKEALYAQELDMRLRTKNILSWEPQVKISLDVDGTHICNYFIDFEVINKSGNKEWHEVKGFETAVYKLKRKLLEATILNKNKNIKYIVIK